MAALGNVPGRRSDAQGRLVRSTQTGRPATLYAYNELGEQVAQAADLNDNGVIDYAGPDRVAGSATGYVQQDGIWWQESRSLLYPASGDDTPMTVATRRARLTGLGATSDLGALASEQVSLDLLGNETVRRTWVDRSAKKVSQTADAPDSTLDAVQTAVNGLVLTNATATGVVTVYGYDDLGRQVTASSASDNGARSVGQTLVYNALGQVASVTDAAGNATAFAYDAAGRQSAVTNALGQVTQTAYDAEGRVLATWGGTYPVAYEYDVFGRMIAMATTRDPAHESLDLWTLVPAGQTLSDLGPLTSDLDVTKWQYDLATGLVTNKVYADGKGTAYAYTADGKLARRTWARGVATDYGYTTAGELASVDYSDTTPDVGYSYDRLGRMVEAATTGVSTNVYSYDVATLARSGETRRTSFGQPETLVRRQDVLGRPAGMTLGSDYAVGYGYDDYGRFGSVASTNTANAVTGQWTYERLPGTDLVAGWQEAAGNTWRRSFEAHRDLIVETESGHGKTVLDSYGYTNDALGRRTARVDAGVTTNAFGYNLRSEVTSAMLGSDQFGYAYDPIGNRLTATNNAAVTAYFANELNQYTNIVSGVTATPTYDDDGNLLSFGNGWTAAWDGENRLVQLTKTGEQIGYVYDHQSRRIAKQTAAGTEVFSYDDWAMIRHTAPGGEKTDYIYGLDLSGTPQGAGTVGGLLGMVRPGDSAPAGYGYDANGNVTLLAGSDGTVLARYAYDPFGNTLSATGALAATNPFRFSTKYWENEAGLYYYGYRFYSPELGRWVCRDMMQEQGGMNLYSPLCNNAISNIDSLGLTIFVTGITREKREVLSIRDINVTRVFGKDGGFSDDISFVKNASDVVCDFKFLLNIDVLGWEAVPGAYFFYIPHKKGNDSRSTGVGTVEACRAHEMGHAYAYWIHVRPCAERLHSRWRGRALSPRDQGIIEEEYRQCKTETYWIESAHFANKWERDYYDITARNKFIRIWPQDRSLVGKEGAPTQGMGLNGNHFDATDVWRAL